MADGNVTQYDRSEGDVNLSSARKKWQDQNLDTETFHWLDRDNDSFLHQSLSTPCLNVLDQCSGSIIKDLQGREYLDFHGNNVHQIGFGHPKVIHAVSEQFQQLSFCTRRYTNKTAIQLAETLTSLAPGDLNRVLFAPGGALAIGMALKLARVATGRFKTISMWDSFHGASLDAISVGGEAVFRRDTGPLLPGTEHVPPPDCSNCLWDCRGHCTLKCADYIEYVMEKEGDIAAVIAETTRSTPVIPPKGYWQRVRQACDKHGALLILDEIPHCLGRTGKIFTFEHYDIVPDIVVIGKGLGGGIFPLAAMIARENLNIVQDRALGHYTHEKNPVACAAALAVLSIIQEEGLLEHARKMGKLALQLMSDLKDRFELIKSVRGLGLLMGIELGGDSSNGIKDADVQSAVEWIMYRALSEGLNFKVSMGRILTLTPPINITQEHLEKAFSILEVCFTEYDREK